ncbi:MATE family efflux transporter [uncultured Maricaulis sp.]|uniref:MATE family efflux transporter n=1 Tax=uncultured Maricaulis sp. TaxID=174710 RepID=UPI0030D9413E|tara:strand:- start:13522 stop:14919 length:1398 start_codon:yes stop_codon:yes gene_type:complete
MSNTYTHGPLGPLFVRTALPIIFLMAMNGLLTVVDAIFLGVFVGADALSAVTLMFPLFMLIIALASLVANGMASVLARHLGANAIEQARAEFVGAHGLSLIVCAILIALFLAFAQPLILAAANGSQTLARMGYVYLSISVFSAPIAFALTIHSTALRVEGKVGLMAITGLLVTLANLGLNYVLIAVMGLGVAGSALGTAIAQALALAVILVFRMGKTSPLRLASLDWHRLGTGWPAFLALGAPQSLSFVGLSLTSAAVIFMLQSVETEHYDTTIAAYGIVMRITSFAFLILMGMSQALQAIIGNNYGAGLWQRSDRILVIALVCGLIYSAGAEIVLTGLHDQLGGLFVSDPAVIAEVSRILPLMMALYVFAGPQIMISTYFQAIGDAPRAAILGLSRTYLFTLPLTLTLPLVFGETGVWIVSPAAALLMLGLTGTILWLSARRTGRAWGLFHGRNWVPQSADLTP